MPDIKREDVEKLAKLVRIKIDKKEAEKLTKDLESIVGYVSRIKEVSVSYEDEPSVGKLYNVMREDKNPHESGIFRERLLNEVPQKENGYVKVKKIL